MLILLPLLININHSINRRVVRHTNRNNIDRVLSSLLYGTHFMLVDVNSIKSTVDSGLICLIVTPCIPNPFMTTFETRHWIIYAKCSLKSIPKKHFIIFPFKFSTTNFILWAFYHVKITYKNPFHLGQIICKPFP